QVALPAAVLHHPDRGGEGDGSGPSRDEPSERVARREGASGGLNGAAGGDGVGDQPALDYGADAPRRRWGMKILAWVLCAVVLWFVLRALRDQFRAVDWSKVHIRFVPTALAVVCVFA